MPVDSRDKRSSAVNVSLPFRGHFPVADGALNQGDRQHANDMYRGILAGGAAAGNAVPQVWVQYRKRRSG